jgi:hypothetical protein
MTKTYDDAEPGRVDHCATPGCKRLTRHVYCDRCRRARARQDELREPGQGPGAA